MFFVFYLFLVFADLHYKQGMYATTVADLHAILNRLQGLARDPQLYLKNPQELAVYGCYGNHELETQGNDMAYVTSRLSNRAVVRGTVVGTASEWVDGIAPSTDRTDVCPKISSSQISQQDPNGQLVKRAARSDLCSK